MYLPATIKDADVNGKKVIMRADYNVPMKDGSISDDSRIRRTLPTLRYLLDGGAAVILMSHLGRPKGREEKFSLKPVAKRLEELLETKVEFAPDCIGEETKKMADALKPKEVLLLENLRFHEAEKKPDKDPEFAKQLADLADIYVNDAFGAAHRKHSSIYTIANDFPDQAFSGFLMDEEIGMLSKIVEKPEHPFFSIVGGVKISTKIGVLNTLLGKVDALFIGGAMAHTFFKAMGKEVGDSLYEEECVETAREILDKGRERGVPVHLPVDLVIAKEISEDSPYKTVSVDEGIPTGWKGVDIGPKTIESYCQGLKEGRTILWNGPLGVFEIPPFSKGTLEIASLLADLPAMTIVGGGDSAAAVKQLGFENKMTHLSTGGGASLELIENGSLPGIEVLSKRAVYQK